MIEQDAERYAKKRRDQMGATLFLRERRDRMEATLFSSAEKACLLCRAQVTSWNIRNADMAKTLMTDLG